MNNHLDMETTMLSQRILDYTDRQIRWLFSAPALLVMLGLFAYPMFRLIWTGFTDEVLSSEGKIEFIGVANYVRAFSEDPHFLRSIWLTLYFAVGSTLGQLTLGLGLALFLNRQFKGEATFRMLLMFPIIATPVAMSLVWSMLMNPMMGHLNYYLSLLGLPGSLWAADTSTVLPSLIMIELWHWVPMTMLVLLAGLKSLPKEPFEAATVDGASRFQMFVNITLPLLQPYVFLLLLLRLVHGLKVFDKIFVISGGGPNRASETLNIMIYEQAFGATNFGYASALGSFLLLIILLISIGLFRFRQRKWSY
ncbi:MAG: sugar ABC transporter permease [Deltaproteobacteria bacterium]|nr:sugar ABC transporter permease [Deltaproteobacteria bacterium]